MESNREDQLERNFLQYRLGVVQRMQHGDFKTAAIAGIEHSLRFLERDNRMPGMILSALAAR